MTTWFPEIDSNKLTADAQKALQAPIGFASPLWFAYAATASAGVAYWWMTQLSKPLNLEAFEGLAHNYPLVPVPETPLVETPLMSAEPPAAPQIVPTVVAESAMAAADAVEDATTEAIETAMPETLIPEPAAEAASVAMEPVVEPSPSEIVKEAGDDLTRLIGIGPSLALKLAELGVRTYEDIASWTEEDLDRYDKSLKLMGRAARENWIGQARQFAEQTTH